ncbi:T-complex protein 11-domain-containing protein [Spinellus fusiger]|nr:T-complex protein 11-domain-containing protein [Spinellus fusiger]
MEPEHTGFYTVMADTLHISKKPCHLQRRFLQQASFTTPETATIKREAILQEKQKKLNQRFQQVQYAVEQIEIRREHRRRAILQSLETAEHKRQTYLDKRRIASKNLVERAKVVAHQNLCRYKAKQEILRARLESRLEESEARRLRLQTHRLSKTAGRTKRAACSEKEKSKKKEDASVLLMNAQQPKKKSHKRRWSVLREAYVSLGLPPLTSTTVGFNELKSLLHQPKVVAVTSKVLSIALSTGDKESRRNARIFLTAYMILMCPREVLEDRQGVKEQSLLSRAERLLEQFEVWIEAHGTPTGSTERHGLVENWLSYYSSFEEWKERDKQRLIADIKAYYYELHRVRQTLEKQEATDVCEQITQQMQQVKANIFKIGGTSAMDGLEEMEKDKVDSEEAESLPIDYSQFFHVQEDLLSAHYSNEEIAHELIMDPHFTVKSHQGNAFEKKIREVVTRAFFDKLQQEIEQGNTQFLLDIFKDLRERLLCLVPPGSTTYSSIENGIDLTILQQQMKNSVFDINEYLQSIITVISTICAPVRDEAVEALRACHEPAQQIQRLLSLLDLMLFDTANSQLETLRPYLIAFAVKHEQASFQQQLTSQRTHLTKTRAWIHSSVERLTLIAHQRNPQGIQSRYNKPTSEAIFTDAIVHLILDSQVVSAETVPETLFLDVKRLATYQNEIEALVIVSALLILAKNFGTTDAAQLKHLTGTLFSLLEDASTTIDHLALEIERNIDGVEEQRSLVRSMVDKTLSHTDTVYSLLTRRVASIIRNYLLNGQPLTEATATSHGLGHVYKPLNDVCHKILILSQHHRKVYDQWYSELIIEKQNELAG